MRIAITGHTSGIGLAIFNLFKDTNEILGFSRSNGFNIKDVDPIVESIVDADIFINNAYYEYQQCVLLQKINNMWAGTNRQIINIGSTCVHYPRLEQDLDSEPWPYRDHKSALEKLFRHLVKQENSCRLHLINPGAVDTDMIKHISCTKLEPLSVAIAVQTVINFPSIKELTICQ